ncbi:MAG: hypothetical protein ACRDXB_05355, partial [Actinomycetes bacterium]
KGIAMIATGSSAGIALGAAVLVIPVVGVFLVWRELQFGRRSAELAAVLQSEGGLPVDDLPRRPSGRVERAAADCVFAERQAETESDPENWRTWYRLGMAYDDAGDRTRARAAVRHAITLYPDSEPSA